MKPITFEKVWETYKVRNKAKKTRMATAASVLVLSMVIGLTPAAQAAIQSWFDVTFIKNAKDASYGYTLPNSVGDAMISSSTKSEAEKLAGMKLAFPNDFLKMEDGALSKEYTVAKKQGEFIGYSYSLRTKDRMIQVNASFKQHTMPQMWAETTKDAMVIERDIDQSKLHILSISEFDGAAAYYEKEDWVIVISAIASGVNEHEAAPFSEEEMVNYFKSIEFR